MITAVVPCKNEAESLGVLLVEVAVAFADRDFVGFYKT